MAEKKQESQGRERLSTINVLPETRLLIGKIAAHRGLTMHGFFQEPDVQTFFTHLLVSEMDTEAKRLKQKK